MVVVIINTLFMIIGKWMLEDIRIIKLNAQLDDENDGIIMIRHR